MFLLPSAPAGAPTPWSKIRFTFLLLPRNHFFRPQMQFFLKNICYFKKYIYLCTRKALSWSGRALIITSMERDSKAVCRAKSRKDVFSTLPVCSIKLSNFETSYSGDATEAFAWVNLYIPTPVFPLYIYNKVYPLVGDICVYIRLDCIWQ